MSNLLRAGLGAALCVLLVETNALYADSHEGGGEPADPIQTGDPAGGEGAATDAAGDAGTAPGRSAMMLVLPKGKLGVNIGVLVNLSADQVAKPISITPDVRYGVAPKLDVGLYHSPMGITGFWGGIGGGLCLTGEDNGCFDVYGGPLAVLANYSLAQGKFELAVNGGLVVRQAFDAFDPLLLAVKAGVNGMYMVSPKLAVAFSPNLIAGLTERDANNKEDLNLPVSVHFAVTPTLHAGVQTGITGPLDGFGDFFQIPVSAGAMFMVNENIGVAAAFNFFNLAGKNNSADFRGISTYVMWHN